MALQPDAIPRTTVSISLRVDQRAAVRELVTTVLKHDSVSRYIQDLIDADLAKRSVEREPVQVAS